MSAVVTALTEPGITGYVEVMTGTAVLGWAWIPGQAAPLTIELQLDGDVIAVAAAGDLREDLAQNGIGEGRHAFTLPVPEAARARSVELRVYARAGDGPAVLIGTPPVEDGLKAQLVQMQKSIDLLIGSQRVLHRNLQAALLERAGSPKAGPHTTLEQVAATQAALQESIDTLELFVVRLETSRPDPAPIAAPREPRYAMAAAAAAVGLALVMSFWALLHSMPG